MYIEWEKKIINNSFVKKKKAANPMQNEAYQRRLTQLEDENTQRRNNVNVWKMKINFISFH